MMVKQKQHKIIMKRSLCVRAYACLPLNCHHGDYQQPKQTSVFFHILHRRPDIHSYDTGLSYKVKKKKVQNEANQ